jgi:hypothetical protein
MAPQRSLGKPSNLHRDCAHIVATANLHNKIDLETPSDLLDNVIYEPEQFPGLIYRMKDPRARSSEKEHLDIATRRFNFFLMIEIGMKIKLLIL